MYSPVDFAGFAARLNSNPIDEDLSMGTPGSRALKRNKSLNVLRVER